MGNRAEPGEPETIADFGRTRSTWTIGPADESDAAAVLALQRRCYAREAKLYDDWTIPPLTQSLSELRDEFATHRILVARIGETVVGSVRACLVRGTCHIGRLVVEPGHERCGIGTELMAAIERAFPDADGFELFTGHLSAGNLALYRRLGYRETGRKEVSATLQLVYLEKGGRADRRPSPEYTNGESCRTPMTAGHELYRSCESEPSTTRPWRNPLRRGGTTFAKRRWRIRT